MKNILVVGYSKFEFAHQADALKVFALLSAANTLEYDFRADDRRAVYYRTSVILTLTHEDVIVNDEPTPEPEIIEASSSAV